MTNERGMNMRERITTFVSDARFRYKSVPSTACSTYAATQLTSVTKVAKA